MVYALPSMERVFKAAGFDMNPNGDGINMEQAYLLSAYYGRPWKGQHCDFHDICLLAANRNVDPKPLIFMAEAAGELEVIE